MKTPKTDTPLARQICVECALHFAGTCKILGKPRDTVCYKSPRNPCSTVFRIEPLKRKGKR